MSVIRVAFSTEGVRMEAPGADPVLLEIPTTPGQEPPVDAFVEGFDIWLRESEFRHPRQVVVELHVPLVQIRTLRDLPGVGARDLRELVRRNASRYFRAVEGELSTGAMWVHGRSESTLAVAAQAPSLLLEGIESTFIERGFRDVRFVPIDRDGRSGPELRTPAGRKRHARRRLRQGALMLLVAFSGWIVGPVAYVYDLVGDHRRTGIELEALSEPLARIEALERDMAQFAPLARAASRQGAEAAWVMPSLARVVDALPDDVHLHRLSMRRSGEILLECHSSDAAESVRRIESRWPGNARMRSTPTPDATTDTAGEFFTLVLDGAHDEP